MQKVLYCLLVVILLVSCNKSESVTGTTSEKSEDTSKAGSFEVSGKNFDCKISKQYFGSDEVTSNYSVLCQQDDPLVLLQVTFANENEARSGVKLIPAGGSYKVDPGTFSVELTGITPNKQHVNKDNSSGTLTSGNGILELKEFKLFNSDNNEVIVNAKISY